MDKILTVIVQTSPVPSHPSTALLQALFRSFNEHVNGIRECRIIIVADGFEEEGKGDGNLKRGKVPLDVAQRYRIFLKRIEESIINAPFGGSCIQKDGSVQLVILSKRHGSAKAINHVLKTMVETPFVMICQHDNFFIADTPSLDSIMSVMSRNPWMKALHFTATATMNYVEKARKRYGIELEPRSVVQDVHRFTLIPLVFWFGRTHIGRTDYYRDFVLNRRIKTGDHLEELLGELQLNDIRKNGMVVHDVYGNFVLDQAEQVLYHLSGRRARAVEEGSGSGGDVLVLQQETGAGVIENENEDEIDSDRQKEIASASASLHDWSSRSTSFTTARSCQAVVPGLALAPPPFPSSTSPPKGRFRQRCFHCGAKGHSYRYCPDMPNVLETETIDLS